MTEYEIVRFSYIPYRRTQEEAVELPSFEIPDMDVHAQILGVRERVRYDTGPTVEIELSALVDRNAKHKALRKFCVLGWGFFHDKELIPENLKHIGTTQSGSLFVFEYWDKMAKPKVPDDWKPEGVQYCETWG